MAEYKNLRILPSGIHPQDGLLKEFTETLMDWVKYKTDTPEYLELFDKHFNLSFHIRYSFALPDSYTERKYINYYKDYAIVWNFNMNMRVFRKEKRMIMSDPKIIESPTTLEVHMLHPYWSEMKELSQNVYGLFNSLSGVTLVHTCQDVHTWSPPKAGPVSLPLPTFTSPTQLKMKLSLKGK